MARRNFNTWNFIKVWRVLRINFCGLLACFRFSKREAIAPGLRRKEKKKGRKKKAASPFQREATRSSEVAVPSGMIINDAAEAKEEALTLLPTEEVIVGEKKTSGFWTLPLFLTIIILPLLFTFKPSEWFIVLFFIDAFRLPLSTINLVVMPTWTYSYLATVLLYAVLALFHFPGKVCLVASLLAGVVGSACLVVFPLFWGHVVGLVVASEVFVGIYSAGEVMFGSLLYQLVPLSQDFQRVASFSRGMRLLGQGVSALLGELLLHFSVPMAVLFYITMGTLIASFTLAMILPFDFRKTMCSWSRVIETTPYPWYETLKMYRVQQVQQLSLFLIMSNGIHPLVLAFMQSLIQDIEPQMGAYNGYLLASASILAFLCALLPVLLLRQHRYLRSRIIVGAAPVVCGIMLVFVSNVDGFLGSNVWPSYSIFVLYQCVFEVSLVVANALFASYLKLYEMRQYAVFFCLAYAVSVGVQALLQFIIQSSKLSLRMYYVFFAGAYFLLFALLASIELIHRKMGTKSVVVEAE
jgi:hypothetical protein